MLCLKKTEYRENGSASNFCEMKSHTKPLYILTGKHQYLFRTYPFYKFSSSYLSFHTLIAHCDSATVQGWRTFLRACAQIVDNFWRISSLCPKEFWAA